MPDAPVVQSQVTPQVQPSADLPMNGNPGAFGDAVGQAFENAGEVATKLHRDAVERANQTATLDADNQVNGFLNDKLYNPKTGLLYQNLGKDAPGAVDKTLSDYDDHVSKVQAGLANDEQRVTFQRMAQSRRFELERQLGSYEHHETTRYADETDASAVQLAQQAAVQNAGTNDPELSPTNFIQKQRAIIADAGQRKGLPPEEIQAQMNGAESATHMGVIDQLLSTGQDGQAKAWFDEHRNEMVPADQQVAANKVEVGTVNADAQRIAHELVRGKDGSFDTRENVMTRMDEDKRLQDNPRLAEAVATRAEHLLSQNDAAVRQAQASAFNEAARIAQDPANEQGEYDPRVQQLKLDMSPQQWEIVRNYAKREVKEPDYRIVDSWERRLANPATKGQAAQQDLTQDGIDPRSKAYERLHAMQIEAIKGGGPVTDSFLTKDQAIKRAYSIAGIKDDTSPDALALSDALSQRVKANEAATGKRMTGDDINALAKQMLVEDTIYRKGTVYGLNPVRPYTIVTQDDIKGTTLPDDKLRAADPALADQFNTNIRNRAARLGLTPDRVSQDGYDSARALAIIARDQESAGKRAEAKETLAAIDEVLRANHKPLPKPGADPGVHLVVPELGGYN